MNMKKGMSFMERWHALEDFCKLGKNYRITCFDGCIFEGRVTNVYDADDDVCVAMKNIRDLSPSPRFDGCKSFGVDSADIASVEEI